MDYLSIFPRRDTVTFGEVNALAFASTEADMRPGSVKARLSIYRNHIEPTFGHRPIASITAFEIDLWAIGLRQKVSTTTGRPLAPSTARVVIIRLGSTLRYAHSNGIIPTDPWGTTRVPKRKRQQKAFLTAEQIAEMAATLDPYFPYGLLVRTAAYSGLRTGELAGLRVGDIDLERRLIEVRRSAQKAKGGWLYNPPKSHAGVRDVPIPAQLAERLETFLWWHPYHNDAEAQLWPGLRPRGEDGAGSLSYDYQIDMTKVQHRYFYPVAEQMRLGRPKWGSLRHSYASMLAAAGVSIYKVSRWMGHASIQVTEENYTHMFPRDHKQEMDKVERYLAERGAL